MIDDRQLAAVLCDEPSTLRLALSMHLERAGFEVVGVFDRLHELQAALVVTPDLVVLDLVQVGPGGVRGVSTLRAAFPNAVLAVFVPVPTLETATLSAGADEVFVDTDLRRFAAFTVALGQRIREATRPEA